jgi:tetratricopeptide (TPR) repeat protein
VIDKIKELFKREKKVDLGSYLKKLSVNRQDLIKSVSEVNVESPINAYLTLAILLREKGEYYKSLKLLEKLKGGNLSQEEERLVILNLALVYRAAGFIDRAEESLKEGIKRFPDESFFYYDGRSDHSGYCISVRFTSFLYAYCSRCHLWCWFLERVA